VGYRKHLPGGVSVTEMYRPVLVHIDQLKDFDEPSIELVCDADYWAINKKTRRQIRRDTKVIKANG
jgi:hypothetical protein